MNFKIISLLFLSIFTLLFSGCASTKYYAPHMSKLDISAIKIVSEKDVKNGIYFNINPYYDYSVESDYSVSVKEHRVKTKPYTQEEYLKRRISYNDMWIVYADTNTYAIPSYRVPVIESTRDRWCRYFSGHNAYLCHSIYFLYDENGNLADKDVTLHAIAINKDKLNKEGSLYQKWLVAGFDSFREVGVWIAIGKSPQEAKRWIDLGVPPSFAKNYDIDDYIYKCYEYNLSLDEVKKWVILDIYNPLVINFLKYNGYTLESFKSKSLKYVLNSMKLDDFFKMTDIKDIRVANGYIYHWKYNTNYKRFFHILKKYYGLEE